MFSTVSCYVRQFASLYFRDLVETCHPPVSMVSATVLLPVGIALAVSAQIANPPTDPPSHLTGKLPALGWNTWNAYHCDINETKVLGAANDFVSLGLKAAGYQYVNIDDCWSLHDRDASTGAIVPDTVRFPNGIKSLADKIHALGLKIGIYSDAGTATCAGYPASIGREALDAATFSSWGIDYLKYDNCNVPANWSDTLPPPNNDWYNSNSSIRYRLMGHALAQQPHPIQYSLCLWGNYDVWTWGAKVGHSWRMSGDASPTWSFIISVMNINVPHLNAIGFYAHNDMDMMEIGNGNLTIQEQRTHFAVWAFMKSPILLGTNLSTLNSTQVAIITNKELLAFSQDPNIGKPAVPFTPYSSAPTTSPPEYYSGKSSKGTHVFIVNTGNSTTKHFVLSNVPGLGTSGSFRIHDMWTGHDLAGTHTASSTFSVTVDAHDTKAYLITPA